MMSGSARHPRVLYVGGWGRSGSTTLGQYLALRDKYCLIGEARFLWDRGVLRNELCSCGEAFYECDFWRAVGRLRGGWSVDEAHRMLDLELRYQRYFLVPWLSSARPMRQQVFKDYVDGIVGVYDAVMEVSGSEVIVDTSKDPQYLAVLLASGRLDLSLLHLVRDSRGSAFSWARVRRRPEVTTHSEYMPRFGVIAAAREYVLAHLAHEYLATRCRSTTLRYEDFVSSHGSALDRVVIDLGLPRNDLGRANASRRKIDHSLSGNPSRFWRGEITLKLDDEWTRAMSTAAFAANTLLTAPLLVKYGYPLRRRANASPPT